MPNHVHYTIGLDDKQIFFCQFSHLFSYTRRPRPPQSLSLSRFKLYVFVRVLICMCVCVCVSKETPQPKNSLSHIIPFMCVSFCVCVWFFYYSIYFSNEFFSPVIMEIKKRKLWKKEENNFFGKKYSFIRVKLEKIYLAIEKNRMYLYVEQGKRILYANIQTNRFSHPHAHVYIYTYR